MELLHSKKFKLPIIYFISDRKEIKDIPIGVPFIAGNEEDKEYFIKLLEYEILYEKALQTGLPFNFKDILRDNGYEVEYFEWERTVYMDYVTDEDLDVDDIDFADAEFINIQDLTDQAIFKKYVKDATCYVNIDVLKNLKVFPTWFSDIEKALETNIFNFATYNHNMYNKQLDMCCGGFEYSSPNRNLLNIDISSSIPKAIGTTITLLSKWMAETLYCDILFTGRSSILIKYEDIPHTDFKEIYDMYADAQECREYRKLITSDIKKYDTCIIFGDNHSVCDAWHCDTPRIRAEDGKNLCKWEINKLICFHTTEYGTIPGFADWFSPKEIEHIKNWVKYLEKN